MLGLPWQRRWTIDQRLSNRKRSSADLATRRDGRCDSAAISINESKRSGLWGAKRAFPVPLLLFELGLSVRSRWSQADRKKASVSPADLIEVGEFMAWNQTGASGPAGGNPVKSTLGCSLAYSVIAIVIFLPAVASPAKATKARPDSRAAPVTGR